MFSQSLATILLASSLGVEAVSVYNYASNDCGESMMSGCTELAPFTCCRFRDTSPPEGGFAITSATNSVRWRGLGNGDIGSWFYPEAGRQCGRERGSVVGPALWSCLSANGNAFRRDGAKWFHLPVALQGNCPDGGVQEALPDPGFKVAMDDRADLCNGIEGIKFPSSWGPISKRSLAGRMIYEAPAEETTEKRAAGCENVQFADTYIWGEGDSVWILKGSEETHNALSSYHTASEPKQTYVDFVKSLGAKFYSDWRESEELRDEFEEDQNDKRSTVVKRDDAVVDAEWVESGAADEPATVFH